MAPSEHLDDVAIRARQLEAHLLHSPEYLRRCDQAVKRQVVMLYLAIALLLFFQCVFTLKTAAQIPISVYVLTTITSFLAIINCLLVLRAKACLRRLNDAWLRPEERTAVNELRQQQTEILARQFGEGETHGAHLN